MNYDPTFDPRPWYTVPEAARALRMSKVTLYRKAQSGKIPSRREGRKVLIPAWFVEQGSKAPEPEPAPAPPKRGPGRPRKPAPALPKRKPGRPRKLASASNKPRIRVKAGSDRSA
jgi:excisionase family DNA binding protein